MDLSNLSIDELADLRDQVTLEIESRKTADREKALADIYALAAERGFEIDELLPNSNIKPRRMRRVMPAIYTSKRVKYRHPEDPSLTWAGHGRKPLWLLEWESSGRSLEETAVL